ncbi:MAG: sigma-70 family RNA polymerase sigma factor [Anaerolineae bacterium]
MDELTTEQFRQLYREFFPRVYAYVAYRVGRAADAEDVVSEVFLRVVAHWSRFTPRGEDETERAHALVAWIFRIAYSQVNQFYRENRTETIALDDLPDIRSDAPSLDHQLLRKERFARLYAHIARLSPRRQEVITLKYFGGLRNQEIAAVMGLDERTVASHLSRALVDLERYYAEQPS